MLNIETILLHDGSRSGSHAEIRDDGSGVQAHAVIAPRDVGRHMNAADARRALAVHMRTLADRVDVADTSDLDAMPVGASPDVAPSSDGVSLGDVEPAPAPSPVDRPELEGAGVHL